MRKCLIVFLAVLSAAPAFAATEQELDEIVVSASRIQEKLKETPTTVNVVSEQQLEKVKYRNPDEVLKRLPGIYSHDFGGESELTSIRVPTHFTNPYTLVLINGLPTSSYGSGSSGQIREINAESIARIEVVKGPASALYGSNAIGGIINIITKNPSATPEFKVWGEAGDYSQWRGGASASGTQEKYSNDLSFNLIDSDGWRDHNEHKKESANLRLQYPVGDNSLLTFIADYVNFDHNSSGTLSQADFETDWQHSYHTFAKTELEKVTPTLIYSYFFDTAELKTTAQMRYIDHEVYPNYGIYKQGPVYKGSHSLIDGLDYNVQVLYTRDFETMRSRLITGFDMEYGGNETETYGLTVTWNAAQKLYTSFVEGAMSKSYDVTTTAMAPYIQLEASPVDKLRFNFGSRYDKTEYDYEDRLTAANSDIKKFSKYTPKFGATYEINDQVNTYASYSEGFVVPTTSQLLTSRYANDTLNPEKATNIEIGLRTNFLDRKVKFDLALFDMEIKDKIITTTIATVPFTVEQYINAGKTSHRGAEVTAAYRPNEKVGFDLTYSFALNEFEDYRDIGTGIDYSGNTMPRSPKHHVNSRLTVTPVEKLDVEVEMDIVSKQYIDDANLFRYSRPVLFNLRASYDFKPWNVWCHVLNLTDEEYATYVSFGSSGASYYSGTPLSVFAGLSYKWSL